MSLPHFLDADPSLLEGVEGLNPDPEKHRTRIIVQPLVGVPLHVNSRIQINLVMHPTYFNSEIKVFNGLTVPLFWLDLVIIRATFGANFSFCKIVKDLKGTFE